MYSRTRIILLTLSGSGVVNYYSSAQLALLYGGTILTLVEENSPADSLPPDKAWSTVWTRGKWTAVRDSENELREIVEKNSKQ